MKRDRFEEMGRTTFAGQLDIDGAEAPETVVVPTRARQTSRAAVDGEEEPGHGSSTSSELPFEG